MRGFLVVSLLVTASIAFGQSCSQEAFELTTVHANGIHVTTVIAHTTETVATCPTWHVFPWKDKSVGWFPITEVRRELIAGNPIPYLHQFALCPSGTTYKLREKQGKGVSDRPSYCAAAGASR